MALASRLWHSHGSDMAAPMLATACVLALVLVLRRLVAILRLPPGPWGFPIVGITPKINKEFHLWLHDLAQKFGRVMSVQMGNQTIVVLSKYEDIKKAFCSRDFVSRPRSELSSLLGGYGKERTYYFKVS
jgi:hypothetical protein